MDQALVDVQLNIPDASCPTADLRKFFYDLYADVPKPLQLLSAARPYVCPFDRIVPHVPQNASVLDVGCGTGALLALLVAVQRISRGLGCDVSPGALEVARGAAGHVPGGQALAFHEITGMGDLPEQEFDAVIMVDVLHHIPVAARADAIAETVRRTAPGGVFIYKDMTDRPFGRRLAHTIDDLIFSHEFVRQVPPQLVEECVAAEGLTLEASEYLPRLVYGNVLRVFRRPKHI